jgi:DNA polymerase-3 subunit beta
MKVVISKLELTNLIGKIQSLISPKPAIPALANVLIEVQDNQLILSATDLTTSMRCFAEAKVIEPGSIALPAKRFFSLIRELTSPQVKISALSHDTVEIVSGSSHFKIHGTHKNEFPTLPSLSGSIPIPFSHVLLKEMLARTIFAAGREDSRYVLNGILLQVAQKQTTFIGTDGKRLAKISTPIDIDPSFQGSYILPIKAVDEMIKMLDDSTTKATVSLMQDKVCLEANNLLLITKLLTGQFPDIERVIPAYAHDGISIHREELLTLLRQISLFTSDSSGSVRFIFEPGELKLFATSSEIGEGSSSMPIDYTGSSLEIAFNPFYFQDILRHSKDETIRFAIKDSYNPGVLTDTTTAIFVIMPMRLNEKITVPAPAPHDSETALST